MTTDAGSRTGAALGGLGLLAAVALGSAVLLAGDDRTVVGIELPGSRLASGLVILALAVAFASCLVLTRSGRSGPVLGVALSTSMACVAAWTTMVSGLPYLGTATGAAPLVVPAVASVSWSWVPRRGDAVRAVCWATAAAASLVLLLGYDPYRDPVCNTCLSAWAPFARSASASTWWVTSNALVVVACVAALYGIWRQRRSTPDPVLVACVVAIAVLGVLAAASCLTPSDPELRVALTPAALTVVTAVAVAALVAGARALLVAARLTRLVAAVEDPARPLVAARGGRLLFAQAGGGTWVEADGSPADAGPGSAVLLRDGSGPVVRLVGAPFDDRLRLGPWETAALVSAREAALARSHRRSLIESQRRMVETTDRERRRIEADLHDGAQQRLVSVKLHLALAARADPSSSGGVALAEHEVQEAITALRDLVHGGVPRTLETEGLPAALRDLASTAPVPVTLRTSAYEPSLDGAIAVYSLVGTVLRLAADADPPAQRVMVVVESGDELTATVTVPGMDAVDGRELALLRDRFGALGGRLTTQWDGTTGTITGVLPCE